MQEQATQIAQAVELLQQGRLVALPTETVYGLAADATNAHAVAAIYAAKGRPDWNPLIIHVLDLSAAEALAEFNDQARALARRFWPGPLTLVLPRKPESAIASLATAGLDSVAIRVPAHPLFRAVLAAFGRPLAAPSANRSGQISPTRASHVTVGDLVLDGGPCALGLESTILAIDPDGVRMLRPGALPEETLGVQLSPDAHRAQHTSPAIRAPGQLASHYAPTKPLRLNATERSVGEWLIGFGAAEGDETLSSSGDLVEAAAQFYDALHRADASAAAAIAVAPIPDHGLGIAINDRLRRAAAPRSH